MQRKALEKAEKVQFYDVVGAPTNVEMKCRNEGNKNDDIVE
jgi:hypothetical protein